jgi:hypothetical protein
MPPNVTCVTSFLEKKDKLLPTVDYGGRCTFPSEQGLRKKEGFGTF